MPVLSQLALGLGYNSLKHIRQWFFYLDLGFLMLDNIHDIAHFHHHVVVLYCQLCYAWVDIIYWLSCVSRSYTLLRQSPSTTMQLRCLDNAVGVIWGYHGILKIDARFLHESGCVTLSLPEEIQYLDPELTEHIRQHILTLTLTLTGLGLALKT